MTEILWYIIIKKIIGIVWEYRINLKWVIKGRIIMAERNQGERTIVFTMGMMCLLLRGLFDASEILNPPDWLYTQMMVGFLICMGIVIVLQNVLPELIVLYAILGLLCIFMYTKSHYYYLISSFICIVAAGGVDLKIAMKIKMYFTALFLTIHIILYLIARQISPELITYAYRKGVQRESFFITHPNTFSMLIAWTIFEFIYVYYEKLKTWHFILIILIITFMKVFSDSNTSLISTILVMILIIMDKLNIKVVEKIVNIVSKYGFLIFLFFFSALTAGYSSLSGIGKTFYYTLNDIFSGRLLYGALVYDYYGGTLFGHSISFGSKTYWNGQWFDEISCDNIYVWSFVYFGIAYMLLIGIGFLVINKKLSNIEKILILAYTVYACMEAYVLNAVFCFSVMFIGKYLYEIVNEKRYASILQREEKSI